MSDPVTYRTTDPKIIAQFDAYLAASAEVARKREALSARLGRGLMIRPKGFGHGNNVVGVERLPEDKPGDLLADGALRVLKSDRITVGPNRSRKAGHQLDREFLSLSTPPLELDGFQDFYIGEDEDGRFVAMAPAVWAHDGVLYAAWTSAAAPMGEQWERIPASVYYAAKEAKSGENE